MTKAPWHTWDSADGSNRCGFQPKIGLSAEDYDGDPCEREALEGQDRCIWHAQVDGKTTQQLDDHAPADEDVLDGA